MPGRRLGSRRVPMQGAADADVRLPCRFCGKPTKGLPSESWVFLGPRTAEYVQGGRIWVCNGEACFGAFDDLLEADEADQHARREEVAEPAPSEHDGPMDDDRDNQAPLDDIKRHLLGVAAHTAQETIFTTLRESGNIYQLARGAIQRTFWASAYGAVGAVTGAFAGFLIGPSRAQGQDVAPESREVVLQRKVTAAQMVRTMLPSMESLVTNMEYDARKELEHMGFYPCEECGVPHVKDEPHQMPPGTYWCPNEEKYMRPGDPKWTKEGYEAAAGERWDLDDVDDDGQVH